MVTVFLGEPIGRVVSVYGAIASPTELTLIMELLERGSLRSVEYIIRP